MKKPLKPKGIAADFTETGLPTRDQVNQVVRAISPAGAPDDLPETETNGKGRTKFTTMLNPDIRERLQKVAKRRKVTISDILEEAVLKYLDGM